MLDIITELRKIKLKKTSIVTVLTNIMLCICLLIFVWPKILDIIIPLNESRQLMPLPNSMEYFIDQEKNIHLLTIYLFLIIFFGTNILIAVESLFLIYTHHTCAMFEITRYCEFLKIKINRVLKSWHCINKKQYHDFDTQWHNWILPVIELNVW